MTKTLTEQWREGGLPDGKYYIKLEANFTQRYDVGYSECGDFALYNTDDIEEVLATVPSYDAYKELVRKSYKLDKIISDSATNQGDCQQIVEDNLNRQIERLQEQLKEANDCINSAQISLRGYMLKINEYKKKWGVK